MPAFANALASTRDRGVSTEPAQSTSSTHWIATCWTLNSDDVAGRAPGAVAWLLLQVVGTETGPDQGDKLVPTTFIQRVNTQGGTAPAGGCPAVGARAFVPYETDYFFYRAQ